MSDHLPAEDDDPGPPAPANRGRRAVLVVTGLAVVAAAVAGAFHLRNAPAAGPAPAAAPATAEVTRGDLVQTESVDGTLDYAGTLEVSGRLPGTITWLPAVGDTIEPGRPLYRVDGLPVLLMRGQTPAYRAFAEGMADGPDVRQLKESLRALGFGPRIGTTGQFTPATAAAVKAWQKAAGLPETGAVELGRVLFLPGAVRVYGLNVQLGSLATPGSTVLKVTGTSRVVSVEASLPVAARLPVGTKVTVQVPGGAAVPASVNTVGSPVASGSGGATDGGAARGGTGSDGVTVPIIIVLDAGTEPGAPGRIPVQVTMTVLRHEKVLSVPVQALVALTAGGYGVQLVGDGVISTVPVQTGMFAGGRVEVSGRDLREGLRVMVPSL